MRITVLGDGGWGTALATLVDRQGKEALIWSAFPEYAREIESKHENVKFLPGVPLSKKIRISSSLNEAIERNPPGTSCQKVFCPVGN